MILEQEREQVVLYGKKLLSAGLTKGTGGNISVLNHKLGLFAISPSGMDYESTTPKDVVVMDLNQNVVDGVRKPSSEYALHTIFYQRRPEVGAVVHTHSTFATVLATLGQALPASSYLVAYAGKSVPCAPYATFGTEALAENCYGSMGEGNAVLMQNHGLIAVGTDLPNTFNVAEQIEQCCKVYVLAKMIGEPIILESSEMENMIRKFNSGYGQIRHNDQ